MASVELVEVQAIVFFRLLECQLGRDCEGTRRPDIKGIEPIILVGNVRHIKTQDEVLTDRQTLTEQVARAISKSERFCRQKQARTQR